MQRVNVRRWSDFAVTAGSYKISIEYSRCYYPERFQLRVCRAKYTRHCFASSCRGKAYHDAVCVALLSN